MNWIKTKNNTKINLNEIPTLKINELNMLQSQISKCLSGEDDTANVSDFDNIKDDLLGIFKS